MKLRILPLVLAIPMLAIASSASARVHVAVSINPFGYGSYAPPVVYQPDPYYVAPPVVYYGGGSWGNGRGYYDRNRHYDRSRDDRGHDEHGHH
jgi:hypothetical protein